ncbi:HD domain-containing protein [Bdellovibrio sp. 22V]|uniref:HD-GYP domain-containing protein n=1 Tax=Bdellovibrio TaxID=958 RepID=UPI002542F939|nr:HD domain-containing phosphohydrolase [Bdellovibrio sp. 22V]WII71868.1 HD domain-containing protein [Bdellovibrio sp. 22V]
MDTKIQDDYVAVSRSEFISGTQVPVDIFLKLSETNYVMILKEGSKVNFDQMHFPEKAEWLYVRKSDFHKCVGQTLTVAGIVLDSEKFSEERKAQFLALAADSIFKEIEHLGFDHQSMEHSKIVSKSIQTLVDNKPDIGNVIEMMSKLNDELIRHSMMVSAISVIVARAMKWTLAQNLEKLALGALLHDVGMKELPDEILELPRHAMNRDQTAAYESHVYRGVEILRSMPSISDDIIAIVLEHHENAPGQGYPRRIRDIKMNPFARIVALADCFSEIVMPSVNNPNPKTPAQALTYIEVTLGQPFHKPAFLALKQALLGQPAAPVKKIV